MQANERAVERIAQHSTRRFHSDPTQCPLLSSPIPNFLLSTVLKGILTYSAKVHDGVKLSAISPWSVTPLTCTLVRLLVVLAYLLARFLIDCSSTCTRFVAEKYAMKCIVEKCVHQTSFLI